MAKTKTSKSTNATLGFEQQICEAACELWGTFLPQNTEKFLQD